MSGLDDQFDPFAVAAQAQAKQPQSSTDNDSILVQLPSGVMFPVQTPEERVYLEGKVEAYREQYALDNVSDLAEVDRCISLELQTHRIGMWLGQGHDYKNSKSYDEGRLRDSLKALSAELRQVKKNLGIDKLNRDRTRGHGSLAAYIQELLDHAQQLGLVRDAQSAKAIELAMELISLADLHKNCVEKERRMFRCTLEDIFEWIDTTFRDEFMVIDEHFRNENQRMWILTAS